MHNLTSPRTDDSGIEQEIQAKGKTAPRVTPADLEAEIASAHYFTAADGVATSMAGQINALLTAPKSLGLLTFCVLTLKNGFTLTGESYVVSAENFDEEIGRKIARENAKQKLWLLLGFRLRDRLAERDRQTP